jgi:hypothetical protein
MGVVEVQGRMFSSSTEREGLALIPCLVWRLNKTASLFLENPCKKICFSLLAGTVSYQFELIGFR